MSLPRREWLIRSAAAASAGLLGLSSAPAAEAAQKSPGIRYCLNTSTLMGQKLGLPELIDIASKAGYSGIEPWIREIERYRDSGGSIADLKKRLDDAGLAVESAIGFANWIVDDPDKRQAGLEAMKRDMDLVAQLGGTRIAAPPAGANRADADRIDLLFVADRYRALLELGRETGVVPQIEIWGSSRNLSRLGEAVCAAVESGHPDACVLPDVYHIYRGGSDIEGLNMIAGNRIHVFHFNDYPAEPAREELNDSDRVYPGAGAAPWPRIREILKSIGFNGAVSLELFNRDYWTQDPKVVARTGLEAMQSVLAST